MKHIDKYNIIKYATSERPSNLPERLFRPDGTYSYSHMRGPSKFTGVGDAALKGALPGALLGGIGAPLAKILLRSIGMGDELTLGGMLGSALGGAGVGGLLGAGLQGRKRFNTNDKLLSKNPLSVLQGMGSLLRDSEGAGDFMSRLKAMDPIAVYKRASTESEPLLKSIDFKNALARALLLGGGGGIIGGLSYNKENDDSEDALINSRLKAILAGTGIGAGLGGISSLGGAALKRKMGI